jgi:hypothetical protein
MTRVSPKLHTTGPIRLYIQEINHYITLHANFLISYTYSRGDSYTLY